MSSKAPLWSTHKNKFSSNRTPNKYVQQIKIQDIAIRYKIYFRQPNKGKNLMDLGFLYAFFFSLLIFPFTDLFFFLNTFLLYIAELIPYFIADDSMTIALCKSQH